MRLLEGQLGVLEGGRFAVEGALSGDLTGILQGLVGRTVRVSVMEILDGEALLPDGFDTSDTPLFDVRVPLGLPFSDDHTSRDDE
jgi:hypothetical protein